MAVVRSNPLCLHCGQPNKEEVHLGRAKGYEGDTFSHYRKIPCGCEENKLDKPRYRVLVISRENWIYILRGGIYQNQTLKNYTDENVLDKIRDVIPRDKPYTVVGCNDDHFFLGVLIYEHGK